MFEEYYEEKTEKKKQSILDFEISTLIYGRNQVKYIKETILFPE